MRSRLLPHALFACLVSLAFATPAHAVPLLDTFGGPIGYGTNILPSNDDGSSSAIDLTPAFPMGLNFFGGPYTQAYVNNNGNITFNGRVGTYTPRAFPIASQPMIAPYWGDVDTRGGGQPTRNSVWWHLEPGRMVVTWHEVGFYSSNDSKQMDFQLIITNPLGCRSGDFDVEFRYNKCEWEAGRASGDTNPHDGICQPAETTCTPAQAGFDAGNSTDFVEIMGSRTGMIRDQLCNNSNVSMPGIWRFSVRGGGIVCPDTGMPCDTGGVGACALGVTQCMGRDVVCAPIGTMTTERCDGIDNDCNGDTDEGDLCTSPEICVQGACVPPCFEGGCGMGESCNMEGICVETACVDVTCPAGQRCSGGECVGACDGVACPYNQQCVAGRCTDLCSVLTCAMGEICVDGACVPTCPCRACAAGETCLADGSCESAGCDVTICETGFHCESGTCIDDCDGAICPDGQRCEVGQCVDAPPPMPDAGMPPVLPDAGMPIGPMDGGGTGDTDAGNGRMPPSSTPGGCDCDIRGQGELPRWAWLLAPFALLLRRRRRA